jgi:hypothetical protein
LERNKNLYKKTEALETYVGEVEERVRIQTLEKEDISGAESAGWGGWV